MDSWKEPSTGNQLEKHLGFFNYFREMIPNYSKLMAPLESLRKASTIVWTQEFRELYAKIRAILTSEIILSYPDFAQPFNIGTDASNRGIGSVLYQVIQDKTH